MRLYSSANSPFCTRVWIAAEAKGLSIESAHPPVQAGVGLRNPEYLAINPVGKIPSLITDDGQMIPESEAILIYLEDAFPTPSLLADDPAQRAAMNTAIRVLETYVMTPIFRTYPQLDPATREQRVVDHEFALWTTGLASLAQLMEQSLPWPQVEAGVSMADCVLATGLHLSTRIAASLDFDEDPMVAHDVLMAYYRSVKLHPIVGPALDRLTEAQVGYDTSHGRPSVAHRHY